MKHAVEEWESFAHAFNRVESLLDIFIFQTQLADWDSALRFIVHQEYNFSFSGGWSHTSLPSDIGTLFNDRPDSEQTQLSIDVSGIQVNSHFFYHDEIDFDIDPDDVDNPSKLEAIFEFMHGLANAVGMDVVLTPEGAREIVIFRFRPEASQVEYNPPGGALGGNGNDGPFA